MSGDFPAHGRVAVEVCALLVAPPHHLTAPLVPRVPTVGRAIDAVRVGSRREWLARATQHTAIELPDVVRSLDVDVGALEGDLHQAMIELDAVMEKTG